jgi:hypothetical protein
MLNRNDTLGGFHSIIIEIQLHFRYQKWSCIIKIYQHPRDIQFQTFHSRFRSFIAFNRLNDQLRQKRQKCSIVC